MRKPRFTTPTLRVTTNGGDGPDLPIDAVTLFSGLGSSSKALRDLGYQVLAHDYMVEASDSLQANGFDVVEGDIRAVDFTDAIYAHVVVVVGGPPCQPFSQGGRNAGENDPRDMIPDFQRCVAQTFPELFILENVRGLASPRHKAYLDRRISEFEALGYVVEVMVLDAADYGTGQSRKRLFVVGRRVDTLSSTSADVRYPRKRIVRTMADVLGWTPQTCLERNHQAPEAAWCKPDEDPADCHYLWPMTRPSTTVVGSFMPEVQAAPGYRSTGDGPRQNAPGSVVTTQAERLALQGLPVDWKVCGSKTAVDLQIGNSCPNQVLRGILEANQIGA